MYYVVCQMETRNASNRRGVGYRSFWLCHSGPFRDRPECEGVARGITGDFCIKWRGAVYCCVDAVVSGAVELGIYGLDRKKSAYQVLLPGAVGLL
jgi:hypothetical protein